MLLHSPCAPGFKPLGNSREADRPGECAFEAALRLIKRVGEKTVCAHLRGAGAAAGEVGAQRSKTAEALEAFAADGTNERGRDAVDALRKLAAVELKGQRGSAVDVRDAESPRQHVCPTVLSALLSALQL